MIRFPIGAATWAIARRDFRRYFNNPAGYVFITLFIFLSATAAFWRPRFFLNNLANLDQLNEVFPLILVFFVPALTMGLWSDERKQGTDELLLTLPASDLEVLAGKTLAALAIYAIAVATSLSHLLVLFFLGQPDLGLIATNYLGYWLAGSALIPIGVFASLLSSNQTIAFILAVGFCSVLVLLDRTASLFNAAFGRSLEPAGLEYHFSQFANGIFSLASVIYLASIATLFTCVNVIVIGRRHWRGPHRSTMAYRVVQCFALTVILVSVNTMLSRVDLRLDMTAERLHALADVTRQLIQQLPGDRPVQIRAFVSPDVPGPYVQPRENLLAALHEIDRVAGGKARVVIESADAYSAASRAARERFGIVPRVVSDPESTRPDPQEIFLAVAFTSGAREQVLPFFDRGMSAEYEIARGIRAVAGGARKRIGIVDTEARLLGGMDFDTARPRRPWTIVDELRREYDLVPITPWDPIDQKVDALLVVMPSTLLQTEMEHVLEQIKRGVPAVVVFDPLPAIDMRLAPAAAMAARVNPYKNTAIAVAEKNVGDVQGFARALGITWSPVRIVWDSYRPHPELAQLPREVVFVGRGNGNASSLNAQHPSTRGLQEVVFMYPGYLEHADTPNATFEPLLSTGPLSGSESYFQLVQPGPDGPAINAALPHEAGNTPLVLAAHVRSAGAAGQAMNVIAIADLDFIADEMFELRRSRPANASFDNITFFLNSLDVVAGDHSLLALRGRRIKHRTLERIERQTRTFLERRMHEEQEASTAAQQALENARNAVKQRIEEIQNRPDLDPQSKTIMARNLTETENRRLTALASNIDLEKNGKIRASRENMETELRRVQGAIRTAAVVLPPIPMACLGLIVYWRGRRRERRMAAVAGRATRAL